MVDAMTCVPATLRCPAGRWPVLLLAGVLACLGASAGQAEQPGDGLVGHRALYDVTMVSAESASGVVDASGMVLYRFADTCNGWTVENHTVVRLGLTGGDETLSDWAYTSWEAKDGASFRFRVRDQQDEEILEELRGSAAMGSNASGGTVRFARPHGVEMALPPGTLFPTAHLLSLLRQGQDGIKTGSATIFDGADLDNPYRVSAVVGPAPEAARRRLAELSGLDDLPVWSVRLAFFPLADPEGATPDFEVGIHYREDGIGNSIVQDFGDIVLKLELKHLEIYSPPDC